MKIKKLLNSMNGFSLVEMTVVLALMGAAAVGVMKMTETANKAGKNIETKDEISQLNNRINDILKNPTNCQASLGGRTLNSPAPFIHQVIGGAIVPKYTAEGATPANPNKVSIDSMIITAIDLNGTNGSQALATLRVGYRKPNIGSVGGQVLNKEILINANLCLKNFIQIPSTALISTLMGQCINGSRLVDGPHTWGAIQWAICQDCTNAITSNKIQSCQSQGSGGGVDISSLTELTCATQGGVWDNATSSCDTGNASCTALGGTYDATTDNCSIGAGAGSLQAKLCAVEAKLLAETLDGGTTTMCVPNVAVSGTGLVNGNHTKKQCTSSGGTIQADFCKFPAANCPGGWLQYNGWSNWLGGSATGSGQGYRTICGHSCDGSSCTNPTISFSAFAPWQNCSYQSCAYQSSLSCIRQYTPHNLPASRSVIGCY